MRSAEHRKRVEALLDESEGVRTFVANHIKADPSGDMTTEEILQHYAVYCGAAERGWYFNIRTVERQLPDIMMQFFKTSKSTNILRGEKKARDIAESSTHHEAQMPRIKRGFKNAVFGVSFRGRDTSKTPIQVPLLYGTFFVRVSMPWQGARFHEALT